MLIKATEYGRNMGASHDKNRQFWILNEQKSAKKPKNKRKNPGKAKRCQGRGREFEPLSYEDFAQPNHRPRFSIFAKRAYLALFNFYVMFRCGLAVQTLKIAPRNIGAPTLGRRRYLHHCLHDLPKAHASVCLKVFFLFLQAPFPLAGLLLYLRSIQLFFYRSP